MAEWRKVAKGFVLGDGHISIKEVDLLRELVLKDGEVSKSELDFLKEIKAEAKTAVQVLDDLIAECEQMVSK
ncbi:hypothetical protein VSS37_04755 [Candidatus Thiothrix sp. Deng01]|uniref:TerB family tellurite resistance protein n=1 Tax=Candidatus Thiothrix phosphatis TaxID=3112415 RepID=A0ABU6CU38_9GAMM|nr:hypothetical protein [Candidatus Thiothrix sp. Deng01]MEB4590279.1 hypothetical protein [Candidatus Thiothrix sp. Deng01]